MYKTAAQLKADLQKPSFTRLIMWLIGQHWRLDAIAYWLDKGMAVPFAKERAMKMSKVEWEELIKK